MTCVNIGGDPNHFKEGLKVLHGFAINELIINNAILTYLPDGPFVEEDGITPAVYIEKVSITLFNNGFASLIKLGDS